MKREIAQETVQNIAGGKTLALLHYPRKLVGVPQEHLRGGPAVKLQSVSMCIHLKGNFDECV